MYPMMFDLVKDTGDNTAVLKTQIAKVSGINNDISGIADIEMPMISVSLVEIQQKELSKYIAIAYAGDERMQQEYHTLRGTLEEQVEYTYQQSIDGADKYKRKYFRIELEEDSTYTAIGYSVLVFDKIKMLYTFGININFRQDNIKTLWLEVVANVFDRDFYIVTLRLINKRAIRFFEKKGFSVKLQEEEPEDYYVLWKDEI